MSNDVTVYAQPVPAAAFDASLTPTQRYELILRAQPGMSEYQAPRGTGESTTREQATQLRTIEAARRIGRLRDASTDGRVSAGELVAAGLSHGYTLPDVRVDPVEANVYLQVCRKANWTQTQVSAWLEADKSLGYLR